MVRRSNHTVTYISGFETFRIDAENLAEGLKTACACSTAVQPDFRDSSMNQIMVQGEHVAVIKECLFARGIQGSWIEVINHTGVKLKKNQTKERISP
jgi:translation initiation factor 2D